MIVDPDAAILELNEKVSEISNDLGAVMRDIKRFAKWQKVIELMNERIKFCEQYFKASPLMESHALDAANYLSPTGNVAELFAKERANYEERICHLSRCLAIKQNEIDQLEHRIAHLRNSAPRNVRLDDELLHSEIFNGGCQL